LTTDVPGGAGARRETTAALPPPAPAPRRKRIEEAGEDEETARWSRAVPAGRPSRRRDVPEASAMADLLCVWLWGEAGDAGRDGSRGEEQPRKQQEEKSGVVVGRPDSWRPGAFSRRPQRAADPP